MIQPLPSRKVEWTLFSVELDEPVETPAGVILPVLLLLVDERGVPVAPPDICAELDQDRAEGLVRRTLEERGAPERLIVAENTEWETDDWEDFASEFRLEIRFRKLEAAFALGFVEHLAEPKPATSGSEAERTGNALHQSSRQIFSAKKKEQYLRKAVDLSPSNCPARIELADIEFSAGKWKNCLAHCEKILSIETPRLHSQENIAWWTDKSTRPFLRAVYLKGMVFWHQGKYGAAGRNFERLLKLNPKDHQGARFFLPMLYLLDGRMAEAADFYEDYQRRYPGDFKDPALWFGWGFVLHASGDETGAREKYMAAILKNIYIAPMLLETPEPPQAMWMPTERAEPSYAAEFVDSYATIWDRDSGSLRFLREVWEEAQPRVKEIVACREEISELQDQRYDAGFRGVWEEALRIEDELTEKPPD